jgi:hypothetical protein
VIWDPEITFSGSRIQGSKKAPDPGSVTLGRFSGPTDVTPLDQLKRCVLPGMKQQIYGMFKYTFTHWPHDMSFRLVLETWLSYIQVPHCSPLFPQVLPSPQ